MDIKGSTMLLCSCYHKSALIASSAAYIVLQLHLHLLYRTDQNEDHEDALDAAQTNFTAALFTSHPDFDYLLDLLSSQSLSGDRFLSAACTITSTAGPTTH